MEEMNDWIDQTEVANYGMLASQLKVDIAQSSLTDRLAL